jgi:hypothetical protein
LKDRWVHNNHIIYLEVEINTDVVQIRWQK